LNKADLIDDEEQARLERQFDGAVICSAQSGAGIDRLLEHIAAELSGTRVEVQLLIPYERGDVVARVHDQADVTSESYGESGTLLVAQFAKEQLGDFSEFLAPAGGE
jgi:GTP-binding protein HflX